MDAALTWEQIKEEFAIFGSTFADDVLPERCLILCKKYSWQASDFYDEWLAWGQTKTVVTDDDLEKMIVDLAKRKKPPTTPVAPATLTPTVKRTLNSPAIGNATPKRLARENILSASFTDGTDSTPARVYKTGRRTGQVVTSYAGKQFVAATAATKIDIKPVNDLEIGGRFQNKNRTTMNMAILERLGKLRDHFRLPEDKTLKDIGGGFVESGEFVYGMLRPPKKDNLPFVLYGDYETSRSASTQVLPKFASFPGEVCVARVGNSAGQAKFLDERVQPDLPALPERGPSLDGNVRIVVSAGPYTTMDTLSYEPYHDFVKKISAEQPDILIMMGPFVDRNHKKLSTNLDGTFEEFFEQLLNYLAEQFAGKRTRLFVVANSRENHTTSRAFPTEKYHPSATGITCLNDPAILDVNGIQIALSSTDILRALSDSMVNVDDGVDVIQLSARKLLEQRSFYPVFPPCGDLLLRLPLLNEVMIDVRPHLMVLPATVAPFVRVEEGTLFVNPGTLVKGMDAGSYTTIEVAPGGHKSIADHAKIQVIKI